MWDRDHPLGVHTQQEVKQQHPNTRERENMPKIRPRLHKAGINVWNSAISFFFFYFGRQTTLSQVVGCLVYTTRRTLFF